MLCFTLATMVGVKAQCGDFSAVPGGPVTINMTLGGGGTVNLTNAILNGSGFFIPGGGFCDMWLSNDPNPNNLAAYSNTPITFSCADIGTSTWHIRAGGNSGVGISGNGGPGATIIDITVNVIDNIPPTISCPVNQVRNANAVCTYTTLGAEFDNTAVGDNCATTRSYTLSGLTTGSSDPATTLSGVIFNKGITTVTWVVRDNALPTANTASCAFTVTVNDVTAPVITCPANQNVGTDNPACTYAYVGANATATDNCTVTSITNDQNGLPSLAGVVFNAGVNGAALTTNVTWTASDGVNSMNCIQMITVTDNDAPSFTFCPMSATVNANAPVACDYIGTAALNPSATDNCSGVTFSNSYDATNTLVGKSFPIGVHNITWTATDVQLNSTNNCTFTLTVKDVTAPSVVGPTAQLFNFNVSAGTCTKLVNFTRPAFGAVTDCSNPVTMSEAYFSGPDPNVLTGAPAFVPGSNLDRLFPAGTTVLRYTWSDAAIPANTFSIDYTFVIAENELPMAKCVAGTVTLNLDPFLNIAEVTPAMINNGSSDNCGIQFITVSPISFDCNTLGNQMVTLTVTDNAGNTKTCNASVFVVDNTLPAIGCPASFVVSNFPATACNATISGLIFSESPTPSPDPLQFTDNSFDNCGLTFDYSINGGAFSAPVSVTVSNTFNGLSTEVFQAGNNTVTIRAKDDSGNIGICNFSVNVQDQTAPSITCPMAVTVFPLIGSCLATATWATPTPTDNCPGAIAVSSTFPSGFSFPGGTTVVTYSAQDIAGNIGTCTFNVLVSDTQFPVAKCKNITVPLIPSGVGVGTVTITPAQIDNASTDNCGYLYVSGNITYTCANIGTNNYTLQIQDNAGNPSSCIGVVTVQDITAPILTCPTNVTINTPVLPAAASCVGVLSGLVSAIDNCTVSGYQYALGVAPLPAAYVPFAGGNLANIPAFPLGVTTLNIRATDGVLPNPNISNICTFTVTVKDVTPPVFAGVPANITVACNAIPPVTNPTATDNCGTATVSYSGQTFGPGVCTFTITRTWVASDNAVPANTLSVSQVITVQDIVGPVFNAAYLPTGTVNVNVAGPSICTGNYTLTVTNITDIADACNGVSGIAYTIVPASGPAIAPGVLTLAAGVFTLPVSAFPIGTNVVTLTATDACGNPTVKVVNIVVTDNQSPVFKNAYALSTAMPPGICGKIFSLPNTSGNCDQLFQWTRPTTNDISDCGIFAVTETVSNGTVQSFLNLINPFPGVIPALPAPPVTAQFPVGETTITYTATQGTNVSVCSFIVKILDTQAPNITCPPNANLSISSACAAAATVPTYPPTSISDNCPVNVVITQTPAAGSLVSASVPVVPGNTFVVTLKATDNMPNNGMSVPCSFTITLVDGQSPVPVITNLPDFTSNCTKDTVFAPASTDCNGIAIVTIYGTPSVPVMMILPPLVPGGPPRYILNPGSYVITWSYTDPQNNTTTQPQNVFITVDNTPPIAIAQPLNVNLSATGNAFVTSAQLNNGSFDPDACGPIDLSIRTGASPNFVYVDTMNYNCSHLANMGVNTIVFAVTDINGNIATAQTTVTVYDVTKPVFTGVWTAAQMDTAVQACAPIPPAASFPQLATDQCDLVVTIALTETSTKDTIGCAKYSYIINRKWTATDDSGNTATRTQKIIVSDSQAPVFAANTPATVIGNTAPNALDCTAAVNFNMAAFVADCEAAADVTITNTVISSPNMFVIPSGSNISAPNYPIGTYVVRFTATDKCGNSATKTVTIQVNDITPPTAVCINGVSASLQPSGIVNVNFNQFNNFSFDNCSSILGLLIQRLDQNPLVAPTTTLQYNCADADGVTQHGVKLFVSDGAGNMSMCLTYIVIQDNVAPTITCPPSKTVQCTDILTTAVQGVATAIDNCPIVADSISHTDAISGGVGNICQVLTRTWKVVDLADNVSTCNQLLSIQDTIKPVFNALPPNVTVSCSDGAVAIIPVTATDNCDPDVMVELAVDTISIAMGDCGLFDYTIVRTWTATDNCGNTNVFIRQIKVVDITEPEFAGMPDTLVLNTSQFPPNMTCTVPLVFDVAQFLEDCTPDSSLLVTNDAPFGDGSFIISGDYPIGNYWVYFSAIDVCGNLNIDSIYIQVIDNSVPTLVCNNNVVIALGTNGEATIDPSDIDLGSTDNCAIDTIYLSKSTFDCGDLGAQTINLTAEDIYGNTNSCVVQVQVTLGVNAGFNLTATGTPESYFGAENGTATAVATGGTGVFTYLWSNMETTAVLDSLAAGTYTVSVTDANSGCISVDTIIVQAGAKITITVGTDDGCQGQKLSIPVTVDNFINVSGFSLGLALSNGAVGMISNLTDVNPALTGLVPGINSVFWTNPNLNPTTLANGTLLFNVEVMLSNAAVGTTSNIVASALPALVFLQDGVNQAPMVVFNNGTATISCLAANDIDIKGDVFTWKAPVKPIPNATVNLAGTIVGTDITALPNADYGFLVAAGSNTIVNAQKISTIKNQQINVGDMLGIQAHAALQVAFNNGYQWVAADINSDQKINLLDYALVQKYVLGNAPHFTNGQGVQIGPDWKFIPSSHVFMPLPMLPNGNPQGPQPNPLNNPVPPSNIVHNNIAVPFLNDDFTGVLMGDVNGSVIPSFTNGGGGGAESAEVLKFRLDERAVQAGETVIIPFKAVDFTNTQAYQMTIAFDPEVFELQDVQAGVLPGLTEGNFNTANLVDGLISTLWVGGKPSTFNDNETLFSLTFKALESVPTLSSVLHSSSDITEALAIDEAGNSISLDFEFVSSVATGEVVESKTFALYQNQPNPFNAQTSISFRLPESGRATLRVFSVEGRLVKTVIGDFAEGINTFTFLKSDFGSNGVYYYELETPKHSDRKKMILID